MWLHLHTAPSDCLQSYIQISFWALSWLGTHIKKDRSCSLLRLQQGARGCSNVAFIEKFRTICFTPVATGTKWCHLPHLRHTYKNKPIMLVSFCHRKPHPSPMQCLNSINNLLLPQCEWGLCGSYVRKARIVIKAKDKTLHPILSPASKRQQVIHCCLTHPLHEWSKQHKHTYIISYNIRLKKYHRNPLLQYDCILHLLGSGGFIIKCKYDTPLLLLQKFTVHC